MVAELACPSCGAPVPLRSAAMPYAVCSYCQTVIVRQDDGLRDIGKSAVLPFDVSPIQLGTTGNADGQPFEVVGRVRWGWSDGSWNEWLLALRDGSYRWLGEAMGQFQLLREDESVYADPLLKAFDSGQPIMLGETLRAGGTTFAAADIKQAKCLGGEGDLPFPTPAGMEMASVDFRSESGESLSVQRDPQGMSAYLGRYVSLEDLTARNLRVIDGWTVPETLR
ncbi:MAG: DUF4178 domain-containing protein [Sphingomonadales bacterium]|nr:DUF4178 domain-containing protein [Sphingomonadales bacterium]